MANYPVDLARKNGLGSCPMMKTPSESYPTLHLDWEKDYELPESGTMEVKFRKVSESTSTHSGKTRYSVSLDILSIEDVEEGDASDEEDKTDSQKESTGDRLDKMAKDAEDQSEGE